MIVLIDVSLTHNWIIPLLRGKEALVGGTRAGTGSVHDGVLPCRVLAAAQWWCARHGHTLRRIDTHEEGLCDGSNMHGFDGLFETLSVNS
jgi:hypothetical protein